MAPTRASNWRVGRGAAAYPGPRINLPCESRSSARNSASTSREFDPAVTPSTGPHRQCVSPSEPDARTGTPVLRAPPSGDSVAAIDSALVKINAAADPRSLAERTGYAPVKGLDSRCRNRPECRKFLAGAAPPPSLQAHYA